MKLLKDSLSNGPHLVSPQYAQKVIGTHILKDTSNNFASGLLEDPVLALLALTGAQVVTMSVCLLRLIQIILRAF